MDLIRRVPPRARGCALIAAAVLAGAAELALVFGSPDLGIDFVPLRNAARHRLTIAAAATAMLLSGPAAAMSLHLGNLSEVLVPVAVVVLLAFHRRRWAVGCAVLAVSLLIKPLLAPLVLIPVLRRRWGALAATMVPAGVLLLGSVLLVPGGERFGEVLRYCLSGTNLHGVNAVNNLSLRGWFETHHAPDLLGAGVAAGVLVVVAARVVVLLRHPRGTSPVRLGNILMLGTLLCGAISEVHFLLVVLATVLLQVVLSDGWRTVRSLLPGLLMLGTPSAHLSLLGSDAIGQGWFVIAELCLLAALLVAPADGESPGAVEQDRQMAGAGGPVVHRAPPGRRPASDPPVPAQA